jgi:hypothetical protein
MGPKKCGGEIFDSGFRKIKNEGDLKVAPTTANSSIMSL